MKELFNSAKLTVEYLHQPEQEKGEVNNIAAALKDEEQLNNAFKKSSTIDIQQEHLPELLDWLHEKGYFTGLVRGIAKELDFDRSSDKGE